VKYETICVINNKFNLMKKFTFFKTLALFAGLLFLAASGWGQIISQYVETESGTFPKGIEIWNNTDVTLDFTANNLVIQQGTNGAALSDIPSTTINSGTLAPGAVLVIGTSEMGTYLENEGLAITFKAYSFTFNGNDALAVKYGGIITDVFGTPGTDPGSAWTGNDVSTANQNIQILNGIISGDLDGWSDPSGRFVTVSTTPSLTGGLAGFGVAPETGGTPIVANSVFNPPAGTYYAPQNISISTTTEGASIYYTTDGTDPDATSAEYTGPIEISSTTTIKAIAYAEGFDPSAIASATYVFPTPTFTSIPYTEALMQTLVIAMFTAFQAPQKNGFGTAAGTRI
jgi:hypothetical protein